MKKQYLSLTTEMEALMVLAVCLKLGFDLAMQPSDIFSVELLK